MTELVPHSGSTELAVAAVRAELAYTEIEGGFTCRVTGASGAFSVAVPVAVLSLGLVAAVASTVWIGVAFGVLGLVLLPRTGGILHGLRVQNGRLHLLGPDQFTPLQLIERVDLTLSGVTLLLREGEPVALQLGQSLGARAWLAERIRESVVQHGDFDDVPAALARLRGEEEPDA